MKQYFYKKTGLVHGICAYWINNITDSFLFFFPFFVLQNASENQNNFWRDKMTL